MLFELYYVGFRQAVWRQSDPPRGTPKTTERRNKLPRSGLRSAQFWRVISFEL